MKYKIQADEESTEQDPSTFNPEETEQGITRDSEEDKSLTSKRKRRILFIILIILSISLGIAGIVYYILTRPPKFDYYDPTFFDRKSLSVGIVETDAGSRILQKILCASQKKSFCYNQFPAEVISDLATVTIIYSPDDPKRTPLLYNYTQGFQNYMKSFGISACLLESIMDNQTYVLTMPNNEPYDIRIKNNQHFFKRENFLNVAIKKLLKETEWQFFSWIDAHQMFSNSHWWEEAIIRAARHGIVQLFQTERYCNPKNVTTSFKGIGAVYELGLMETIDKRLHVPFYGNAWTISRDTYEKIGYIYDEGIGGSTDFIFSMSTKHNDHFPWTKFREDIYYRTAIPWLEKAVPIFNNSGSFVRGSLTHLEHERTFVYYFAIKYIKENYADKSLLDALHRTEDFQLILDDPNFGTYLNKDY